jgi:hypothetical protein
METGTKEKRPPAPYISWKTFTSFLDSMKGKLTAQIDASVLTKMSGTARSQLLSALRFLTLISADGTVQDKLRKLSDVHNTPQWKEGLAALLNDAYDELIGGLDIAIATPAMLRDRFKNFGGVEGATIDRAMRFYISGLKEAGIAFSPHLLMRASRGGTGMRRRGGASIERIVAENAFGVPELPPEGTFRIPFDLLGVAGSAILPSDIDPDRWKAISEYVSTVIGIRQRARKIET